MIFPPRFSIPGRPSVSKIISGFTVSFLFLLPLRLFPFFWTTYCPPLLVDAVIFLALFLFLFASAHLLASESVSVCVKFCVFFAGSCIFFTLIHFPVLNWGDDYAHYILEAKAWKEGAVEELGERIVRMRSYDTLHRWFVPQHPPVGFPYMLCVAMLCGIDDPVALSWIPLLCFSILTAVFWLHFRHILRGVFIFVFLIYSIGNSYFLSVAFQTISDMPFLCFSFTALLLADRLWGDLPKRGADSPRMRIALILMLFLLCGFSLMLRSGGMALLPCLLILQLHWIFCQNRLKDLTAWSEICVFAVFMLLFVLWYRRMFPSGNEKMFNSMLESFSWSRLFSNLGFYYRWSARIAPFGRTLGFVVFWSTVCFTAISVWRRRKSHAWLICWGVLNFIPLLFMEFRDPRYLLPIQPFCIFAACDGAIFLWRKQNTLTEPLRFRIGFFLPPVFHGLLLAIILSTCYCGMKFVSNDQLGELVAPRPDSHPMTSDAKQMFDFLSRHCSDSELIGCFKPRVFHLFTKLDCVCHIIPIRFGPCHHYCLSRRDMAKHDVTTECLLNLYPDYYVSFQNGGFVVFSKRAFPDISTASDIRCSGPSPKRSVFFRGSVPHVGR